MEIVCLAGQAYLLLILIRIILSWATMFSPPTPGSVYASVNDFFISITEPVLGAVRNVMPTVQMGTMAIDLSALVVLLGGGLLLRVIGCGGGLFG